MKLINDLGYKITFKEGIETRSGRGRKPYREGIPFDVFEFEPPTIDENVQMINIVVNEIKKCSSSNSIVINDKIRIYINCFYVILNIHGFDFKLGEKGRGFLLSREGFLKDLSVTGIFDTKANANYTKDAIYYLGEVFEDQLIQCKKENPASLSNFEFVANSALLAFKCIVNLSDYNQCTNVFQVVNSSRHQNDITIGGLWNGNSITINSEIDGDNLVLLVKTIQNTVVQMQPGLGSTDNGTTGFGGFSGDIQTMNPVLNEGVVTARRETELGNIDGQYGWAAQRQIQLATEQRQQGGMNFPFGQQGQSDIFGQFGQFGQSGQTSQFGQQTQMQGFQQHFGQQPQANTFLINFAPFGSNGNFGNGSQQNGFNFGFSGNPGFVPGSDSSSWFSSDTDSNYSGFITGHNPNY